MKYLICYGNADIVSFSSQMIAAARVTEGEQEDALFVDPYAARLAGTVLWNQSCRQHGDSKCAIFLTMTVAGRRALLKHRKLAKQDAAKRQEGERRTIGNITCRTKYLDDLVVMFTQSSVNTLPTYFAALAKAIAAACRSAPQDVKQVVLVGAGMDARAYRLDVPHDVQWFELDRGSVLKEKQALLGRDISNEMVTQASTRNLSSEFLNSSLICSTNLHPYNLTTCCRFRCMMQAWTLGKSR